MKKKMEIPSTHDTDLRTILDKYKLSEKIDNQELRCARCNRVITWDNISAFRANGSTYNLYCDDTACIEAGSNG